MTQPKEGQESSAKAYASGIGKFILTGFLYCDIIKLREHPKASLTKYLPKGMYGQGNDLGYGKNSEDAESYML
jgi:hypothetical protein